MSTSLQEMLKQRPELYGCFGLSTIQRAKTMSHCSSSSQLTEFVRNEISHYRMSVVNKRF